MVFKGGVGSFFFGGGEVLGFSMGFLGGGSRKRQFFQWFERLKSLIERLKYFFHKQKSFS